MSDKKPNPIDEHVGHRLKLRRTLLQISQEKLGEQIGVTFQQIQKYEKGKNRIGASRLKSIADVLHTDVSYFFSDRNPNENLLCESDPETKILAPSSRDNKLMMAFKKIKNEEIKSQIIDLVYSLAEQEEIGITGEIDIDAIKTKNSRHKE